MAERIVSRIWGPSPNYPRTLNHEHFFGLGKTYVHNEETYFTQDRSKRRRSRTGIAVPGGNGSGCHRSCSNRGGSQAAHWLLLHSSRRDHGEYLARAVI